MTASPTIALRDMKSGDRGEIESTMNEQVLESSKYPEIAFESTAVSVERPDCGRYRITVNGNRSLHGVTRSLLRLAFDMVARKQE
jgi:polyisoprenoid-binding protein YceI